MDRYSEYKDSGIEWIGKIPSHWTTFQLKRISIIETGSTPSTKKESFYLNGTTLWVKPGDLNGFKPIELTERLLSQTGVANSKLLKSNSILVCGIGSIGKFGFSEQPVCTNQQLHGITFLDNLVHHKFGLFLISSMEQEFKRFAETVVVSMLTKSRVATIAVPVPQLSEQYSIFKYLDQESLRIDALTDKLKHKIKLLKEYRQSLISDVVTGKVKVAE